MSISCVDCSSCGKCYKKESMCPACSGAINLLDAACAHCGEPISSEMRQAARAAYMQRKREEHEALFPALKAKRASRGQWLKGGL